MPKKQRLVHPFQILRVANHSQRTFISQGHTLTFFDAHVEVTQGWLEPIQTRIASDRSVVAVPMIERVSSDDMGYETMPTKINGFRWSLIFNWYGTALDYF